jgi:glutathione synthase/RimK-type ligase-like ATP-grasp enzyme
MRALVVRSHRRCDTFIAKLQERGVQVETLDFDAANWNKTHFGAFDIVIYYPEFSFTSNHPLALWKTKDNFAYVASQCRPGAAVYPDPGLIPFYNDKYRQYLFLSGTDLPIPETLALVSDSAVEQAIRTFGWPMVVKNRFGAGGDSVFKVERGRDLRALYDLSRLNLTPGWSWIKVARQAFKREFWYYFKNGQLLYPVPSWPLIAQRFYNIQRDLKIVVGEGSVVEAHWRRPARRNMWKMNIDAGAVGEWGFVPERAIEIGERLASTLGAGWLNVDLLETDNRFLIGEFSPVWHHYKYREKESFVYSKDYNIPVPLERALDLEGLIVDGLLRRLEGSRQLV